MPSCRRWSRWLRKSGGDTDTQHRIGASIQWYRCRRNVPTNFCDALNNYCHEAKDGGDECSPTTGDHGFALDTPGRAQSIAPIDSTQSRPPPRLSKRPKDLFELYREYQFGIGGSKPAKLFSSAERGSCRSTYSLRLGFWSLVDGLVRKGHTSETAIDLIYSSYGVQEPVVAILRKIRTDKKRWTSKLALTMACVLFSSHP
jgi:hypothetical protein